MYFRSHMKVAKSDVDSFPSPEYFKYILSKQIYFRGINNERSRNVEVISVNTHNMRVNLTG